MAEAEADVGALLGHMLRSYRMLRGDRNFVLLFGGQEVLPFED